MRRHGVNVVEIVLSNTDIACTTFLPCWHALMPERQSRWSVKLSPARGNFPRGRDPWSRRRALSGKRQGLGAIPAICHAFNPPCRSRATSYLATTLPSARPPSLSKR